jgi:hypothetical protein
MTRANTPEPPRLATWLLEQFSPVLENAPLAGDLIEAFKQGRSSGWYWRQVFGAILIVALPTLLRKQWGCLAYAVGWGSLVSAAWFFVFPNAGRGSALPPVVALYARSYTIQWPWSLAYQIAFMTAFQAVIVVFALGVYLAFCRISKPQNLFRAFMVSVVVLTISNAALPFLAAMISPVASWMPVGWMLISTPTIVALLVGMWKANLGRMSRPIST